MSDCTFYSVGVTINSSLRALIDEDPSILYQEYLNTFGPVFAITLILGEYKVEHNLINQMWNDFSEYIQNEFYNQDNLEITLSIVSMFLDDSQEYEAKMQNINKYFGLISDRISKTESINSRGEELLLVLSRQIYNLDHENLTNLAFELITRLFKFLTENVHEDYKLSLNDTFVFESENLIDYFNSKEIDLNGTNLFIKEINLKPEQIVRVELSSIKNAFSLNITTSKVYSDGVFEDTETHEVKWNDGDVKIKFTTFESHEGDYQCINVLLNSSNDICEISEVGNGFVVVKANTNGIYKLSKSDSGKSSSSKSDYTSFSGPICFLLPTSIVFMILIPFLNKLGRRSDVDEATKRSEDNRERSSIDQNQSFRKGSIDKPENDDTELKLKPLIP